MTVKQNLMTHLKYTHATAGWNAKWTHKRLVDWHLATHRRVLTHNHNTEGRTSGYTDGSDQRPVRLCLIKPRNPSSSKAEDRNWTLQIVGHENPAIINFVRLYSTRDGDEKSAIASAEQWLGYSPDWTPTGGGGYEVQDGRGK
jgi:hypothetical protein